MVFKNTSVLSIGEILWDRFPAGSKPGGAPLNVAVHLNKFEQNVTLLSRVGNDKAGLKLTEFLKNAGLQTNNIQFDKKFKTSEVIIKLDNSNNATYEICEPVAWDFIETTDNTKLIAAKSGIIIYGSLASRNKTSRETISELLQFDNIKFIDVNLRPPYIEKKLVENLISMADIAKLNEEELKSISGWYNRKGTEKDKMLWFADHYQCEKVCLTKGANGAILLSDGKIYYHPGFKIKLIDSVGAGDAFTAGFITALLKNKSATEILTFACASGAYVASKEGATPNFNKHEFDLILK